MPEQQSSTALEAAQMRVLELFGAVCADPDNPGVAEEADSALEQLEDLLRQASSTA